MAVAAIILVIAPVVAVLSFIVISIGKAEIDYRKARTSGVEEKQNG